VIILYAGWCGVRFFSRFYAYLLSSSILSLLFLSFLWLFFKQRGGVFPFLGCFFVCFFITPLPFAFGSAVALISSYFAFSPPRFFGRVLCSV
jgi:hypothetical protein